MHEELSALDRLLDLAEYAAEQLGPYPPIGTPKRTQEWKDHKVDEMRKYFTDAHEAIGRLKALAKKGAALSTPSPTTTLDEHDEQAWREEREKWAEQFAEAAASQAYAARLREALEEIAKFCRDSVECYPQVSEDEQGGYVSQFDAELDSRATEAFRAISTPSPTAALDEHDEKVRREILIRMMDDTHNFGRFTVDLLERVTGVYLEPQPKDDHAARVAGRRRND